MRSAYDHITQPAIKLDHLPDDWHSVLSTARAGRNYDGLDLDLNCPVTRIDWWDAHAYAKWKGGRLPTQEEWLAAATLDSEEAISAGGWGPVDQSPGDVTPRRIHGLAGNVAEWSENPERNPAFPMNAKSPVACGGTFSGPGWWGARPDLAEHPGSPPEGCGLSAGPAGGSLRETRFAWRFSELSTNYQKPGEFPLRWEPDTA